VSVAAGSDSLAGGLTLEQKIASAFPGDALFIEAGPGTGKTTVAAHRFGVERFNPARRGDDRAVVAVSFTRAATWNLRRRIQRLWGPAAFSWPHRIITLDTVISDLVHDMLRAGLVTWPNGHTTLDVRDSWAAFTTTLRHRTYYDLQLHGTTIHVETGFRRDYVYTYPAPECVPYLYAGKCTHDDIRRVLELAMKDAQLEAFVKGRLAESFWAIIVDEIFDANDLDLRLVKAAIAAGVRVTMVGDPWQALYLFRGAKPAAVRALTTGAGVATRALTRSFRWQSVAQAQVADDLRERRAVVLAAQLQAQVGELDAVLAVEWKPLWELSDCVLPIAYGSFKGTAEEASATLLLNYMTRTTLGLDATYLNDSLTALAITEREVLNQLESEFQQIVDLLRPGGQPALRAAYEKLIDLMNKVSPRTLRATHGAYTKRLNLLRIRSQHLGELVPGLTTHQAKGGEWDRVGLCLTPAEQAVLLAGLDPDEDLHRKLYVACTRARYETVLVL
jgi:DNA helicase-2/ATP-dependent DNA helicase PcrA